MNTTIASHELNRTDIAAILASIGEPGTKREEKIAAVKKACEDRNTGVNPDGHAIWETLADWGEF